MLGLEAYQYLQRRSKMASVSELIETKEAIHEELITQQLNELVTVREQMAARSERFDIAIAKLQEQKAEAIGTELPAVEKNLVKSIKTETAFVKHTVKGEGFQAVWNKGRTSWNTKGLVSLIPEIQDEELKQKFASCQRVGKPSVSIRIVKKAEVIEEIESLF